MDNKEFGKQLEKRTKLFALEIIAELNWVESDNTNSMMKEASEILALFTSIGKKLKL